MRYLTIRKFANEVGYTEAAIRSKIADGTWIEDQVWRRAPDNRILIDVHGFEEWVVNGKSREVLKQPLLRSPSSKISKSSLSPPPLVQTSQGVPELTGDKIHEKRLAELIGTTPKALEHKRREGIIPEGVWLKERGRIMYSLARYNEWAEKQWVSRIQASPGAKAWESISPRSVHAQAKRVPIKPPRKGSQRPVITMLE
ncbi:hypothetical protein [Pseudomonas sp. NFACC04-2]|uniref:hypothetical protein n=1 Tax=Pseudomonas sp. NFACC04-2 TaxID=1566242 RepID=UPI0015A7489F|nr:hypothetical protein [Pseudomonas sp. NFACC04-2]